MNNREKLLALEASMNQQVIGQQELVRMLIVALLCDGHVLLEGLPCLAKTRAVHELARHIEGEFVVFSSRLTCCRQTLPAAKSISKMPRAKKISSGSVPARFSATLSLPMSSIAPQPVCSHPVGAFGNSDGDVPMLQYTSANPTYKTFGLLVHHTDAVREYAYDRHPPASGKLISGLRLAPQKGWVIVDMKKEWKTVFDPAQCAAVAGDK